LWGREAKTKKKPKNTTGRSKQRRERKEGDPGSRTARKKTQSAAIAGTKFIVYHKTRRAGQHLRDHESSPEGGEKGGELGAEDGKKPYDVRHA